MKHVAIIAPQFLPCSYPPAHRVRFFTNHLEAFGWKPVVLCADHAYMEEPADAEFEAMVPTDLEVIRVRALSPRWTRKLGIGDLGIRVYPYMLKAVRKLCSERKIDCLFIPGPPWHTFLIGAQIKREFGIPFVIDYIDPWVSSWGEGDPPWRKAFWYRQMAKRLEPLAVRHVSHVTAVSEGTNDGVRERYQFLSKGMFTEIPYGGEPGDFDYLRQHPRENPFWDRNDGNCHLVYVGAMLPKAYDTLRALFQAARRLEKETPDAFKKLRFHFFGTTYDPFAEEGLVLPIAREEGLAGIVTEHPRRVPYLDAINILCQADGILALGTTETHYTASKIFPCMLAERPLLAIYHEASSVVETLTECTDQTAVTYSSEQPVASRVDEIKEHLLALAMGNTPPVEIDLTGFEPFTARSMTQRLTGALNTAVGAA